LRGPVIPQQALALGSTVCTCLAGELIPAPPTPGQWLQAEGVAGVEGVTGAVEQDGSAQGTNTHRSATWPQARLLHERHLFPFLTPRSGR